MPASFWLPRYAYLHSVKRNCTISTAIKDDAEKTAMTHAEAGDPQRNEKIIKTAEGNNFVDSFSFNGSEECEGRGRLTSGIEGVCRTSSIFAGPWRAMFHATETRGLAGLFGKLMQRHWKGPPIRISLKHIFSFTENERNVIDGWKMISLGCLTPCLTVRRWPPLLLCPKTF